MATKKVSWTTLSSLIPLKCCEAKEHDSEENSNHEYKQHACGSLLSMIFDLSFNHGDLGCPLKCILDTPALSNSQVILQTNALRNTLQDPCWPWCKLSIKVTDIVRWNRYNAICSTQEAVLRSFFNEIKLGKLEYLDSICSNVGTIFFKIYGFSVLSFKNLWQ